MRIVNSVETMHGLALAWRARGVRVGFVHVPPVEVMPLAEQQRELARLIQAID